LNNVNTDRAVFDELSRIADQIIEIKKEYNNHWELYSKHVTEEQAPKDFDQIVDQLVKIIECYKAMESGKGSEVIVNAREAGRETIKAGCSLLRTIMDELEEAAETAAAPPEPTVGTLTDAVELLKKAREKKAKAIPLAEADEYEGFVLMKEVISILNMVPGKVQIAVNSARPATRFRQRETLLTRWGIIVAILIAVASFFREEIKQGIGLIWQFLTGQGNGAS